MAVLLAAGTLVSFVAAAGGAIIWVRFHAARLPADQALAAMPRGELIASGAVMLSVFVLLGILAVVGVYLFDAKEYQPRGMGRGLLALVTVECMVVVALAVSVDWERRVVAAEGLLLFGLLLLLVVRWRERVLLPEPRRRLRRGWRRFEAGVMVTTVVGAFAAFGVMEQRGEGWVERALVLGGALVLVGLIILARWVSQGFSKLDVEEDDPVPPDGTAPPDDDTAPPDEGSEEVRWGRVRALIAWVRKRLPARRTDPADMTERERLEKVEWQRRLGKLLVMVLTTMSLTFASMVVQQAWLIVTLVSATLLGVVAWRVAVRTEYDFFVCGVVVFVSVPLLGTVAGVTRNYTDPQVQPIALVRQGDLRTEALEGIYVTETDDRVYFATVATDGCGDEVQPGSGRLLWVPRDEVVAMSLGPPQNVEHAGERAREMRYALAPAVDPYPPPRARPDTSGERRVARLVRRDGERRRAIGERRLDTAGPALRRYFDVGPRAVRDGDKVTLMPAQPEDGDEEVVFVDGHEAEDGAAGWDGDEEELWFEVPPGARAKGGRVTVDCDEPQPPMLEAEAR